MSKYHPIDVRHPANRQYRNRNYLLGPPAQNAGSPTQSPRRAPGTSRHATRTAAQFESHTAAPQQTVVAAPWGGGSSASDNSGSSDTGSNAGRGSGTDTFARSNSSGVFRWVRVFLVLGVIGWVLSRETRLFDRVLFQLRIWAHELGISLPF